MKNIQGEALNAVTEMDNFSNLVAKISQSIKTIADHVNRQTANKTGGAIKVAPKVNNNVAYINQAAAQAAKVACELKHIYSQFKV